MERKLERTRLVSMLSTAICVRGGCRAVCLWWVLAVCCPALAQYRFDQWTSDNGLPQNSVKAIRQTRDGYLWLTTFDGLVRFDGVRFTVYNKSNSPGLGSNRCTSLYEDRDGTLWLGTENAGLTHYQRGTFTTFTTQHGLPDNFILGTSTDETGNLWLLSANQVGRLSEGRFLPVTPNPFPNDLNKVGAVIEAEERGGFWAVNDERLFRFINGRVMNWTKRDGLPSLNISNLAADRQGVLWVATLDAGLIEIRNDRVVKVYAPRDGLPGNWCWLVSGPNLKLISRDAKGALWLTELASWRSQLMSPRPPEALMALDDYRSYEDREGNLWIGTEGGGLFRARRQTITMYSKEHGLASGNIYPVIEDREGQIWLSGNGTLSRFSDSGFTTFTTLNSAIGVVRGGLYADRANRLWIGSESGVQFLEQGHFTTVRELRDLTHTPWVVSAMCEDREGAIWLGARTRLIRYRHGAPTVFTSEDGFAGDEVKALILDAAGSLWIGAYGGLTRYQDGRFTRWTERDGLPGNNVRALYAEPDGTLWIGTYDSGLGRFKDGKFTRYTTRDGLQDNGVFQILEDGRGNFWMSSNRGIYRVSKQELNEFAAGRLRRITSIAYGKSDGMLSSECNGGFWPAGVRARDGRLWFPTQDGVAVIDPASVTTNLQPPPVVIESLMVERTPVALESEVRIRPGQAHFEIEYTALSFINSQNMRFRYKLEGLDHDWVEAGTRRTAYYSYVPPGDYDFNVIASNSDGVWNTKGQSLRITVLPPFYRTWWFLSLAALLAGGVIFAAYQYRFRQLTRERSAQLAFARQLIESQESERKRIAAELHDGLGQKLILLRNWAALGLLQSAPEAPVREQLNDISTTAAQSLNEVREIIYNLRPSQLESVGLSDTIRYMLTQLASASRIQWLTEVASLDGLFAPEQEVIFFRVVQECVNNIVKHAQATEATALVEREGDNVHLTIEDNGRGFNPAALSHKGFGLKGLHERVRMLGGQFTLESMPGKGTRISIAFEGKRHAK